MIVLTGYRVQRRASLLRLVELQVQRCHVLAGFVRAELQDSMTTRFVAGNRYDTDEYMRLIRR